MEAHASDEWPISEAPRDFRQHTCLAERLRALEAFQHDLGLPPQVPWFADPIGNQFNSTYASWPFRFWVMTPDKITFKPMPKGACYDMGELDQHLEALLGTDGER